MNFHVALCLRTATPLMEAKLLSASKIFQESARLKCLSIVLQGALFIDAPITGILTLPSQYRAISSNRNTMATV